MKPLQRSDVAQRLPSPGRLFLRLGGSAALTIVVLVLLVQVAAWAVFPLRPGELRSVLRLVAVVGTSALVAVSLVSLVTLRRAGGVHRAVRSRLLEHDEAPPEGAMLGRLFAAPARAMFAGSLAVVAVVVLDGTQLVSVSGITGMRRVGLGLLTFGVFQSGFFYLSQLWRRLLWAWLQHLPPREVDVPTRASLAFRFTLRLTSAVLLVACAVGGVCVAFVGTAQELAGAPAAHAHLLLASAGAIALVGALSVAVLGLRLGRRIATDVEELATYVRGFTEGSGWSGEWKVVIPRDRMRTQAASGLVYRFEELSERYEQLARVEAEARRSIEEAQRLKTRFMAFMSHDLRSPLNSITGFADILDQGIDGPLNPEQRESLRAIRESGEDLLRLVTDIVDSARLEAGKLALERRPTDVVALVREAVDRAQGLVRGKPVRFRLDVEGTLPEPSVDAHRLTQALTGVLFHVVRMVLQGTIQVIVRRSHPSDRTRALAEGDYLRIEIAAEALPPEDTQRIFVAFRDIRRPSGGRVGGLGLGLYLARSLVLAHGGELLYETTQGARFIFAIPDPPLPG